MWTWNIYVVTNLSIFLHDLSHALVMKAVESGTYIHKIADYKSHSTIYTVCTLGTEVNKLWSHSAKHEGFNLEWNGNKTELDLSHMNSNGNW